MFGNLNAMNDRKDQSSRVDEAISDEIRQSIAILLNRMEKLEATVINQGVSEII